ncbi:hypothetical protein [Nocardia heshunensis]
MSDKSPRSKMSKAQGKSLKEKRAEKKADPATPPSGVEGADNKAKKRR